MELTSCSRPAARGFRGLAGAQAVSELRSGATPSRVHLGEGRLDRAHRHDELRRDLLVGSPSTTDSATLRSVGVSSPGEGARPAIRPSSPRVRSVQIAAPSLSKITTACSREARAPRRSRVRRCNEPSASSSRACSKEARPGCARGRRCRTQRARRPGRPATRKACRGSGPPQPAQMLGRASVPASRVARAVVPLPRETPAPTSASISSGMKRATLAPGSRTPALSTRSASGPRCLCVSPGLPSASSSDPSA